jgi:hypothetical protein
MVATREVEDKETQTLVPRIHQPIHECKELKPLSVISCGLEHIPAF